MNELFKAFLDGTITAREALEIYYDAYNFLYDRCDKMQTDNHFLMEMGEIMISKLGEHRPDKLKELLEARHYDPFISDRELAAFCLAFAD